MAYRQEGARLRRSVNTPSRPSSAPLNSTYLSTTRARLRLALFVAIGAAVFLSFVVFPARRAAVSVDGSQVVLISREQDAAGLLNLAGVAPEVGDVVVREGRDLKVERAVPVIVEVDGRLLAWRTRAADIDGLLDEMDVEVGPYDGLVLNGAEVDLAHAIVEPATLAGRGLNLPAPAEELKVDVIRAVPVTLIEDGRTISLKTIRPTVDAVLREAGIKLGPADIVSPRPAAAIGAGMEVRIDHARSINLRVGSGSQVLYTHKETLKEALVEAGYALGPDDRVEPAVEADVTNGMLARLVRVAGRTLTEREPVKKKTVFKPDENLSGFNTRTVQGQDGTQVREYRIVIEDGVEREKSLVKQYMEPETQDTVIYYASSTIRATGFSPENMSIRETKRMFGTWYNAASSGRPATDANYGITRSGVPVTRGVVAVDPAVIPLGTRLYVPGYGFAVAGDTGGGIVGDMIDVGFADGQAVDWHTGWTDVYILGQ